MPFNKKFIAVVCLLAVASFSALTSMSADDDHPGFKNIKVLPKNPPHELIHQVMDEWSKALGVRCNFCHARSDDGKHMDFASDAKPEKNMARDMYKMMAKINNKYFEGKKDSSGMVVGDIKCFTCHRGTPHPDDLKGGMDMHHDGMEMHHDDDHHDGPPPPAPPGNKP